MSEGGNEKTDRKSRAHIPGWELIVATMPFMTVETRSWNPIYDMIRSLCYERNN